MTSDASEKGTAQQSYGFFHEQYTSDGDLVLFRCKECGYVSMSIGSIHAHIEKHRGYTRFGIQLPFTKTAMGNHEELNKRTEVLRVDEATEIELEEVEGL